MYFKESPKAAQLTIKNLQLDGFIALWARNTNFFIIHWTLSAISWPRFKLECICKEMTDVEGYPLNYLQNKVNISSSHIFHHHNKEWNCSAPGSSAVLQCKLSVVGIKERSGSISFTFYKHFLELSSVKYNEYIKGTPPNKVFKIFGNNLKQTALNWLGQTGI